jgi:hypothetical protein
VAVTRALAAVVVSETEGSPLEPVVVAVPMSGEVWSTPVNEAPASLMASVLPAILTDRVFDPEEGFTKYHISEAIPPHRVLVALVRGMPL